MPLSMQSTFFESADYPFPKPLAEIDGTPMIQHVIENLSTISEPKRFIFILSDADCTRYHLDSTVRLLAGDDSVIVRLFNPSKGAACSALLAINYIGNDDPLLIVNGDQIFDVDLNAYLARLRALDSDAGCLTFNSVHPRWSYLRTENQDDIIETSEKHPISRQAIAGFYYFARGADFVLAAQLSIRKDACVDGVFYIAPVLNELVLLNRRLKALSVPNDAYHTFYSPKKIDEYQASRANRLGAPPRRPGADLPPFSSET
jgi:bifunctional N-acetylglucosamine-1-phosphate-uridyltransferase/glucosamine-1-phosphate-acetyltransferase GlmU-like protein